MKEKKKKVERKKKLRKIAINFISYSQYVILEWWRREYQLQGGIEWLPQTNNAAREERI